MRDNEKKIRQLATRSLRIDKLLTHALIDNDVVNANYWLDEKQKIAQELTQLVKEKVDRCDYCKTVHPTRLPQLDIALPVKDGHQHKQQTICWSCLSDRFKADKYPWESDDMICLWCESSYEDREEHFKEHDYGS